MRGAVAAIAALLLAASTAGAWGVGDLPPAIDLPDRKGREVDLEALRGKVVVINFWASWCGPCREEMPVLEQLHGKYAEQGLVIVGVNIDSRAKKMEKFLTHTPVTFRLVHDPKMRIASRYALSGMPTSYFIGRGGRLRDIHQGFQKRDTPHLEARIQALLAERGHARPPKP